MGSEATWTTKNSPESPSLELNKLITKLKSSMFSTDTINENKKLSDLLKKKDKKIESLKSEYEELEYERKEMVEENQGLKNELREIKKVNDECLKKLRIYEKRVLDFEVWVLGLKKLGKELDSLDFSDKKESCSCIQHMSSGKEESKPRIDEKFLDTIQIDDDDEDGGDDEDDLKRVPSSKRYQFLVKLIKSMTLTMIDVFRS
nr:hypothetical protein [Tanacetum cinerariifolium]